MRLTFNEQMIRVDSTKPNTIIHNPQKHLLKVNFDIGLSNSNVKNYFADFQQGIYTTLGCSFTAAASAHQPKAWDIHVATGVAF